MGSPTKELALREMAAEEIASRIAAATRSNNDAVAVPGLEESGVEARPRLGDNYTTAADFIIDVARTDIPPSEWSPTKGKPVEATIGQPEAANSEGIVYLEPGQPFVPPANDNYTTLRAILNAAFAHAATGKGKERHARDLPFDEQPMLETTRLVGPGFPLGQAIKKAGEAAGMIERGELGAAEAECLGAINYLAGAVAWMRDRKVAA